MPLTKPAAIEDIIKAIFGVETPSPLTSGQPPKINLRFLLFDGRFRARGVSWSHGERLGKRLTIFHERSSGTKSSNLFFKGHEESKGHCDSTRRTKPGITAAERMTAVTRDLLAREVATSTNISVEKRLQELHCRAAFTRNERQ